MFMVKASDGERATKADVGQTLGAMESLLLVFT